MYKIELAREAEKFIRSQNKPLQTKLVIVLRKLAENPRPPKATKLKGLDELYRVRVGNYRIVYTIEDQKLLVLIVRIAHRKDVYKRL
jgi:mRNA interferase RelE/StbE